MWREQDAVTICTEMITGHLWPEPNGPLPWEICVKLSLWLCTRDGKLRHVEWMDVNPYSLIISALGWGECLRSLFRELHSLHTLPPYDVNITMGLHKTVRFLPCPIIMMFDAQKWGRNMQFNTFHYYHNLYATYKFFIIPPAFNAYKSFT
jgi:hypothetical protein